MSSAIETTLVITDESDGETLEVHRVETGGLTQYEAHIGNKVVAITPADANVLYNFLAEG